MEESRKSKIHTLTKTAIVTAVICVLAPLALPIGPVPISLATLAIYFALYLLDWKLSALSVVVYVLIGMVGLPVFSGFTGGMGKLMGPTGGYIVGYIPMALLSGWIICRYQNRWIQFAGLVGGTALLYVLGTAWFCIATGNPVGAALGMCVVPFIPGDLIKIAAAMLLGPQIQKRLQKAGY